MAKTITTIKKIETLGKRELRYTEMDGVKKYDIRAWKGDKYEDGVRFTEDEIFDLRCVMSGEVKGTKIGNKDLIVTDNGDYALSIINNGRTYVRPFATKDEMNKLCEILKTTDNLLEYDDTPKVEEPKKKRGRPKKEATEKVNTPVPSIDELIAKYKNVEPKKEVKEKKKVYKNAYEKFNDQFKTFRESQPENRRKGYELTHKVIVNHIKDIIETSDEYNKNAMQEWKTSHNMMSFCQNKAFENAEEYMNIQNRAEAEEFLFRWVDEYIGDTSDKPKPKKTKTKQKA